VSGYLNMTRWFRKYDEQRKCRRCDDAIQSFS